MGQKLTNDPYDYRFYIDAAVLAKIKEMVNNGSSTSYLNILNSIKVGPDQTTVKPVEDVKAAITNEATTENTSIDFKSALDILRFKNDPSNPYYPKGENATPESIQNFTQQYETAQEIMLAHVGTDPSKITDLPSRVVVAQKDFLLQGVKQARQDEVKTESEKLSTIQTNTVALKSQYETAKSELARLQSLDVSAMTIDQQQAHATALAQAKQSITDLRTQIHNNLSESKTTRENIVTAEKTLGKTDKEFKKSLKKAEKKVAKEERVTFKQHVKNIKSSIKERIADRSLESAFQNIVGKDDIQDMTPPTIQPESNPTASTTEETTTTPTEITSTSEETTTTPTVSTDTEDTLDSNTRPVVLSAEETAAREKAKPETAIPTEQKGLDFKSMSDEQLGSYVEFNLDQDKSAETGIVSGHLTGVAGSITDQIIPAAVEYLSRHPNMTTIELKNLNGVDLSINQDSTAESLAEQWQTAFDAKRNQTQIADEAPTTVASVDTAALTAALTSMGYTPQEAAAGASAAINAAEAQKAQTATASTAPQGAFENQ